MHKYDLMQFGMFTLKNMCWKWGALKLKLCEFHILMTK